MPVMIPLTAGTGGMKQQFHKAAGDRVVLARIYTCLPPENRDQLLWKRMYERIARRGEVKPGRGLRLPEEILHARSFAFGISELSQSAFTGKPPQEL